MKDNISFKFNFSEIIYVLVIGVISSLIAWAITENLNYSIIVICIFFVIYLVAYFIYKKLIIIDRFKKCGILEVYQNQNESEVKIKDKISTCNTLDVLAVRGLGIFGLKDSLIRDILIKRAGQMSVRVVFLSPYSKYMYKRANEVGEDIEAFRKGIILAQDFVRELKLRHKVNIKAYSYDSLPIWRLLFIDNRVFISSYQPAIDGHKSPVYEIIANNEYSFYSKFKREFDFIISNSVEIN